MDHSVALKGADQEKCEALRLRMDDAGRVFEFVVLAIEKKILVNEATHRRALIALHEQIMTCQLDWHRKVIRRLPDANFPEPSLTWDLDKATATPLTVEELRYLITSRNPEREPLALYNYFRQPSYVTEFSGGEKEAEEVFREWLEVLGLDLQDDIVVIDWAKGFSGTLSVTDDATSKRELWSDYFDSEWEGRGIWCLTIWNPRRGTLSALAASITSPVVST